MVFMCNEDIKGESKSLGIERWKIHPNLVPPYWFSEKRDNEGLAKPSTVVEEA